MPATVNDAYHLLRFALVRPDPVIFIEHKSLYTRKGVLDKARPDAPWGRSMIRRPGSHLTIVSYSRMVFEALAAAERLAHSGIETEVVDLRTLNPLDDDTVFESVRRTGRAMVVSEAPLTAGFAAELSARISERCFDYLEEPVIRLAGEDIPIPVSPSLERASVPTAQLIEETALWLVNRIKPSWAA
jgi:pyruvate dehydrogenase E1 component beta subunit